MRMHSTLGIAVLMFCAATQASVQQSPTESPPVERSVLPIPATPFKGTIGLRPKESTPSFPSKVTAPAGAPNVVPAGKHAVVMNFTYDGGGVGKSGTAVITVDGAEVAKVRVVKTTPFRFSTEETLDFGEDTGTPVDLSYDVPHAFTGKLGNIVIDLK